MSNTVTLTQSCGGLPITLTASTMPGIVKGTDTSGYIIYVGLYGPAVVPGSQFALIEEAEGSLGTNGNGGNQQWQYSYPFSSVQ